LRRHQTGKKSRNEAGIHAGHVPQYGGENCLFFAGVRTMPRREFQLSDGSSHKFWAITLEEKKFTVQFGRIGTSGQTQAKEFDTAAVAEATANELIAEKIAKGYTEVGAPATTPAAAKKPAGKRKAKTAAEAAASSPAESPSPVPASPPAGPPTETAVARHLDLAPADWFYAAWRNLPPLPRPDPKPYDAEDCAKRFCRAAPSGTIYHWGYGFHWEKAAISPSVTPEEARFWFAAMTPGSNDVKPRELALYLTRHDFSQAPTGREVLDKVRKVQHLVPPEIMVPLWALLTPAELADFLTDGSPDGNWQVRGAVISGFRKFVLPYLTAEHKNLFRDAVRGALGPAVAPLNIHTIPTSLYLAAMLGLHDEVLARVTGWPDGCYATAAYSFRRDTVTPMAHHVVFGLGSAELVAFHARRLGLKPCAPDIIRGWLANTEYAGLDLIRDAIRDVTTKDECDALLATFCLVNAPEAAQHMLELRYAAKSPGRARQWLDQHLGNAVAGLIPTAAGRGKLAEVAVDFLRDVKRRGFAALIEEQLGHADPAVADALRRLVLEHSERVYPALDDATTPEWLKTALGATPTAKAKLPVWAHPSSLPPLLVGDRRLNNEQATAVLAALQKSMIGAAQPLVTALAQNLERPQLDTFAWKLFELWQSEGAPSKEKWAFTALGHLGGDASVLKLTPLVKAWPGQSQHQRAVTGLECLRKIGTDTALMQLNSIAQKLKFKGLKGKAQTFMEEIAKDRGMTRTQLEDRIVPDLDLDERGSRVFDFGPRQFKFVLDADMKPMVRDEAGKLKGDLPKPNSKDDADKAKAAVDAWKLLKKQIKEVVKIQAVRLEQAMVSSRRWGVEDFEKLLVRHPLMINLVRRLLWGGYDKAGKLRRAFRVTEEQEYADSSDNATSLDGLHEIGIVHPLQLGDDERAKWGEVFGDYEIIPPFPQLGRRVNTLLPGEETAKEITRYKGPKINPMALAGIFDKLGWQRGPAGDGGGIDHHTKDFPNAHVRAVVEYEPGYAIGGMDYSSDQTLERGYFVPLGEHGGWFKPEKSVEWGQVDPVVVSEVLGTMAILASKGT
jgi:predicted DNA-binding WGR domain protein